MELERIIGADALRIVAGIAFTLFGIGFITELAIFMKSPITLAVVGLLWALMMALELAVTGVTIYWIVSLDSLANDQMLTLQVTLIVATATTTTTANTTAAATTTSHRLAPLHLCRASPTGCTRGAWARSS